MARVNEIERILENWDKEVAQAREFRLRGDLPAAEYSQVQDSCYAAHRDAETALAEIDKIVAAFYEKHNI